MNNFLNLVCDYKNNDTKELLKINCENEFNGNFLYPTGIFQKIDFVEYKFCGFDDINESENFYYIINTPMNISNIMNKCGGLPLNKNLIDKLKINKNLFVLYINETESDESNAPELITNELNKLGINPKQFYFLSNNSKLKSNTINVHSIDSLLFTQMSPLKKYNCEFIEDKKFMFMTHNRNAKNQRIALIMFLNKNGILNDTDWSLILGNQFNRMDEESQYQYLSHYLNHDLIEEEINFINKINTKRSFYEEDFIIRGLEGHDMTDENKDTELNMMTTFKLDTYINSYINLTTESLYDDNDIIHISEKSYKPFYFYQIPMILASHEHTKYMKDKFGFDFFDDLVDHSYDNESDNKKRFTMYTNEIKRLYENKNDVINFYKSNKSRFIKNKELLIDATKNKKDYNYFKNLI